ncbi:hypothetical protein LCGC14_1975190 [marine sediment metagenome]|uniref:Uncharacterized protein n=1 Tax=marine sediment metagenome TaxID=412755 RepID=A0A0F9FAK1_9ZZZZ
MVGTFSVSQAVIDKAGKNVSDDLKTGWAITSEFEKWIEEAEAVISTISRFDYVANSAAITTNGTPIIKEVVSNLAAIQAVKYDMSGYTTIGEAESIITVLRDGALRDLSILRDQKGVKFVKDGA